MRGHSYERVKRMIDITGAALGLAVLSPVLAAGAAAVLVSMGRPVLFRQQRPGRYGEPFTLVKLRTMRNGDGDDAARLTTVGRALRSTSIDELPELWNVLKGDMSLVGPRPLLTSYLPLYDDRQAARHLVRPGLTGLAQINGRNELDWAERLETDVQYVEQISLTLDLRIIASTIGEVFRRNGISADGAATMPYFTGTAGVAR